MPRYFFHIRDGEELIPDDEGSNLADLPAARKEAAQTVREIIAESVGSREPLEQLTVEIWDEEGPVESVSMSVVTQNPGTTIH